MKRKGFWIILILVVVAVVLAVVFINLFGEKDTKSLSNALNNYVGKEEGYLYESNEDYQKIDEYLESIYAVLSSEEEKNEVKNYQTTYSTLKVAAEFFNREMAYTKYTTVYKDNRKKIENDLKNGQSSAEKLANFVEENKELVGGSSYWKANSWANCKGYMEDLFSYTVDAINLLGNVYEASVPSKILNNDLTTLIFDTTSDLLEKTTQNLKTSVESVNTLNALVKAYLTEEKQTIILNYVYNTTAQENVKAINEKTEGWEDKYTAFLSGNVGA